MITVSDIAEKFGLDVLAGKDGLNKCITGVYIGDLLSHVMINAKEGDAWLTIWGHLNIVGVAYLAKVSCVIVCESVRVSCDAIERADACGITILSSEKTAYELAKCFAMALQEETPADITV